ncbi:MAG: hypothetical protein RJQ14_15900 [Marinoscillum sp.]|jgi:hypothetical protein
MYSLTAEQHAAVDEIYEEYMRVLVNHPTDDDLKRITASKERRLLQVLGRESYSLFKKNIKI